MAKKISGLKKRQARKGMMLTIPYVIFAIIFFVYPLIWMIILTFTHWNFIGTPKFVGLQNIIRVFCSSLFWLSVWNTIRFFDILYPYGFYRFASACFGSKKACLG